MKKSVLFLLIVLLVPLVLAQNKISIEMAKGSFLPGENISFIVALYDSNNNPMQGTIDILLQDSSKTMQIPVKTASQQPVSIGLDNNATFGSWTITAKSEGAETTEIFTIEPNEEAKFELNGDVLAITNTGNTLYSKTVNILIGDSLGTKNVELGLGEKLSFRLLAPDGTYTIKISDGKTTLTKGDIQLTGNAIGVVDQRMEQGSALPVGVGSTDNNASGFKNSTLIYVFILTLVGAGILLAIERYYRKK
jgi:hypothetical protein